MSRLVYDLIHKGYLRTDAVIDAFMEISRIEFVPDDLAAQAEKDIPLPIGFGQTVSQPLTVAFMFELLSPTKGQNILDLGSGSGWTTAMLCYIVGQSGKVTAVDRIKELCNFGRENAEKYGFVRKGMVEFHQGDALQGFEHNAPYDRILVSASVDQIPEALKRQLKVGGKMVIPVHNDIWYVEKKTEDEFKKEEYMGFSFVPLAQENPL